MEGEIIEDEEQDTHGSTLALDDIHSWIRPEEEVPDQSAQGSTNLVTFTLHELNDYTNGFEENNRLACGGFGCVYEAFINGRQEEGLNGLHVAIKVSYNVSRNTRMQWNAEITHLPKFNHPNIINLIGKCETTKRLFLVYPFLQNGTILRKLSDLNWSRCLKIMRGAAAALKELQDQSPALIHNDFKSANIMLDKDFNPILTDFGTVMQEGTIFRVGTPGYTDPLVLSCDAQSKETDIFSMGTLILQIILKEEEVVNPQDYLRPHISQWAKTNKGDAVCLSLKRTGCWKSTAIKVTQLGLDCCKKELSQRPTIDEVIHRLSELQDRSVSNIISSVLQPCIRGGHKELND